MTAEQWIELIKVLIPVMLAFLSLLGVGVTAVITFFSNRKINQVQAETRAQTATILENTTTTDQTSKKADTIIEKAAEIHELTNGQLSRVSNALDAANARIEAMQRLLNSMIDDKYEKRLIAERLADRAGVVPTGPPPHASLTNLRVKEEVVIEGTMAHASPNDPPESPTKDGL